MGEQGWKSKLEGRSRPRPAASTAAALGRERINPPPSAWLTWLTDTGAASYDADDFVSILFSAQPVPNTNTREQKAISWIQCISSYL